MVHVFFLIIMSFRLYVSAQQVTHFLQLFKTKLVQFRSVLFREVEFFEGGHCGGRACASGVGNAGVAGLGALRGPMVFPTLHE